MNMRSLFVCSALLLVASVAYGAGSYQRTRDGKTLVWNDSPELGKEATWSGKSDKNGFATGSGTLTWYKVEPIIVTGSNIPDVRRHAVVIGRYSGEMVQGKLETAVTYVSANGKILRATFVDRSRAGQLAATRSPSPRKKATLAPTPAVTTTSAAEQTPSPTPPQTATPTPERMAAPISEQHARQPDAQSTVVATSTPPDDSLRSLTAPPLALPEQSVAAASPKTRIPSTPAPLPSPTPGAASDAQIVAALDTVYQAAVKANDIAIMDRILADDFVLVTGGGAFLTKTDLIKEAREKRTIYERREEEEATRKVRVWGDTAVVTALLRIKGTSDQHPLDYKVWLSDTYVRTPTGWRYVFGQASIPLPRPDAN